MARDGLRRRGAVCWPSFGMRGRAACSWPLLVMLLGGGIAVESAARTNCSGASFFADFETSHAQGSFSGVQLQSGTIEVAPDPLRDGNSVVRMQAGPRVDGRVGKAHLIHRFAQATHGDGIEMGARFLIPEGSATNSVILMDLECADCGLSTNPGIRLYLRDGRPRVDRSKIGIGEPFYPDRDLRIGTGVWLEVVWRVVLGEGEAGRSAVYLDGKRSGVAHGTTILTQAAARQLGDIEVTEGVDRFQIGLTANSNDAETELILDDVWFCLRRKS